MTVASICNRGGMLAMAFHSDADDCLSGYGGLFERTGLLSSIVEKISFLERNQTGLVASTTIVSALGGYVFCVPIWRLSSPSRPLAKRYEELGIDKCVMSRSISDGALTFCPIVPWGSSGVFICRCAGHCHGWIICPTTSCIWCPSSPSCGRP